MIRMEKINFLKKYYPFLKFQNHKNEKEIEYITICEDFLFRRDHLRMFAIKLQHKYPEQHYSFSSFPEKMEEVKDIFLTDQGIQFVDKKDESIYALPLEEEKKELEAKKILKVFQAEHHKVFKVKSEFIMMEFPQLQRKIINKKIKIENVDFIIDLDTSMFILKKENDIIEKKEIPIEFIKGEKTGKISYSFEKLKNMIGNMYKYKETVNFFVHSPHNISYFTVFPYEKGVFSVLMHKVID